MNAGGEDVLADFAITELLGDAGLEMTAQAASISKPPAAVYGNPIDKTEAGGADMFAEASSAVAAADEVFRLIDTDSVGVLMEEELTRAIRGDAEVRAYLAASDHLKGLLDSRVFARAFGLSQERNTNPMFVVAITKEEFRDIVADTVVADEAADAVFRLVDTDGRGSIEKAELMQAIRSDPEVRAYLQKSKHLKGLLKPRAFAQVWRVADADGDGGLSMGEFRDAVAGAIEEIENVGNRRHTMTATTKTTKTTTTTTPRALVAAAAAAGNYSSRSIALDDEIDEFVEEMAVEELVMEEEILRELAREEGERAHDAITGEANKPLHPLRANAGGGVAQTTLPVHPTTLIGQLAAEHAEHAGHSSRTTKNSTAHDRITAISAVGAGEERNYLENLMTTIELEDDAHKRGQEGDDIFMLIDLDGSGFVGRSELLRAIRGDEVVRNMLQQSAHLQALLNPRQYRDAFDRMDISGDGTVSLEEFREFVAEVAVTAAGGDDGEDMHRHEVTRMFRRLDITGSGVVDRIAGECATHVWRFDQPC